MKQLQHYVPACYLANFGIDGNKGRGSHVYCLFVQSAKESKKRVDDIALENGFYDVEQLGERRKIIEDFYSKYVEPQLSALLLKILSTVEINPSIRQKPYVEMSEEDRRLFSAQMALQYTRTKEFRNHFEEIYKQIVKTTHGLPLQDFTEGDFKRIHNHCILDFSSSNFFANLFDDRNWVFLVNHTDTPFITSDAPIVQINHHAENELHISPVSTKATMFYPLSPQIAVEMYHKSIAKADMQYFDVYRREIANWYNDNEISNCTRVVISNRCFEGMYQLKDRFSNPKTM